MWVDAMKILLAMNLPYLPPFGGAAKVNRIIAESLGRDGDVVRVLTPAFGTPPLLTEDELLQLAAQDGTIAGQDAAVYRFRMNGVDVQAVRRPGALRGALRAEIASFAPDRILIGVEEASLSLLQLAMDVAPNQVVAIVQSPAFLPFGPQSFFPGKRRASLMKNVPLVLTVSNFMKQYLSTWGGIDSFALYMPAYGSGPFPRTADFSSGFVTLINPCRIKGLDVFLGLARAFPFVRFAAVPTWGGTRQDMAALRELGNVSLLKPQVDIDGILSVTRVLLVPSLWLEAFGCCVVDAMLRGIPVLAANVGGLPEAKQGTSGLLPVRPIERFLPRTDENMIPEPELPEQDLGPWKEALSQLLNDRTAFQAASEASHRASVAFVSRLSLAPFSSCLRTMCTEQSDSNRIPSSL